MLSAPDFCQKQFVLAFLSRGDKLSFQNDNIIIKDAEGKIKHQSTCYRLFSLLIVGHASITTGLIQRARKFKFNMIFMGHNFHIYAKFNCPTEGNLLLRQRQYKYYESKDLKIAKLLVANKIQQSIATLKTIRDKSDRLKNAIRQLETYQQRLDNEDLDLNAILGLEGIAAKVYFSHIFVHLPFKKRQPRVKQDPVNTILDIGYTLLFNFIEALLEQYGFDLYQGVYHQQFYQRKSLVCDLVEPFRTIIDCAVVKAFNLGQIKIEDFDIIQRQYQLKKDHSKKAFPILLESILEHKATIFLYIQTYYRCVMRKKPVDQYPIFDKYNTRH